MTIGNFLARLQGVKRNGEGFTARCPAHEDEHNSISISEGADGRILVKCFAGCTAEQVTVSLGLSLSDLMPPKHDGVEIRTVRKKIAEHAYVDEEGSVLYVRDRYNSGQKISQRRPDGHGGWIANLDGVKATIYRRDKIAKAPASETIFWVEGEKCVEKMESIRLTATTSGGAESWRDSFAVFLRGRQVVILPDNDDPGRRHAENVYRGLLKVAASVRIVNLPLEEVGDDVADWIDDGGSAERLSTIIAEAIEGSFLTSGQHVSRFHRRIEDFAEKKIDGVRIGLAQIDEHVRGMRAGNVYLVCGDTSHGKTALGVWAAINMARAGHSVAFASLEMPIEEIDTRFISSITGFTFAEVEECFTNGKLGRVLEAEEELKRLPIGILDTAGISVRRLGQELDAYRAIVPVDILIVDYIQYLTGDEEKSRGPRQEEATRISRAMKALSKTRKIPVLSMAQFRRRDVKNEDHKPSLERLRETGALEQDASAVIGIHWPHRDDNEQEWLECDLYILKNRNGKCGTFVVGADWSCSRFFNSIDEARRSRLPEPLRPAQGSWFDDGGDL